MKPVKDRDKQILIAVLNGSSFEAAGRQHDVTRERARQIVCGVVSGLSQHRRPEWGPLPWNYKKSKVLRDNKDFWLREIARLL